MQRFDLKRFRLDRKLTQKELAEILMCKQNYISNIENGIKPISKEKLDILQSKFGDISRYYSDISPKSGSLSTIIRSYKSVVSKHARLLNPEFNWQPKFHDHVIRNSESFERIQNYIENNPSNWKEDKFYTT